MDNCGVKDKYGRKTPKGTRMWALSHLTIRIKTPEKYFIGSLYSYSSLSFHGISILDCLLHFEHRTDQETRQDHSPPPPPWDFMAADTTFKIKELNRPVQVRGEHLKTEQTWVPGRAGLVLAQQAKNTSTLKCSKISFSQRKYTREYDNHITKSDISLKRQRYFLQRECRRASGTDCSHTWRKSQEAPPWSLQGVKPFSHVFMPSNLFPLCHGFRIPSVSLAPNH